MTDRISLVGTIATPPNHLTTATGVPITSFRLASTERRYDRGRGEWIDGHTNWVTVVSFRQLAVNAGSSLEKGQRVLVEGRLRVREWEHEGKKGVAVEIEADAIGHDLTLGTSAFTRVVHSSRPPERVPDEVWSADASTDEQPALAGAATAGVQDGDEPPF